MPPPTDAVEASTISLAMGGADKEHLARLTEELARDVENLARELDGGTELLAKPLAAAAEPGTKGDPVTIGSLVLAALTGGAVVKLLNVLETYVKREPKLTIRVKTKRGETSVEASNLGPAERKQLEERMFNLLR